MHDTQLDVSAPHPVTLADQEAAAAVFDRHGSTLHLLAMLLTDDPEIAEQIVVQAVVAHVGGPASLQQLSAALHLAWCCRIPASGPPQVPSIPTAPSSVLAEMQALPIQERLALGLCRFGGHTYREAADVLSLSPGVVARQLASALRTLAV